MALYSPARLSGLLVVLLVLPLVVLLAGCALAAIGLTIPGVVLVVVALVWVGLDLAQGRPARLAHGITTTAVDPLREPRLVNLVDGLCVGFGVAQPELRLLADPAPNALVLGSGSRAQLICTTGLIERLDRMELEAVLAHELAHLKRGDAALAERAALGCGALIGLWSGAAALVARCSGAERESLADLAGAGLTRYPPGLVAALEACRAAPSVRPAALPANFARTTASWWFAPLEEAIPAVEVPGRLNLELRAAALREL